MSEIPVFTTTVEAYCLFGGSDDRPNLMVERRNPQLINESNAFVCVYLDGGIEHIAGFDIPSLIDGKLEITDHEGTPCKVELDKGIYDCSLFLWLTNHEESLNGARKRYYGYIHLSSETERIAATLRMKAARITGP